MYWLGLDKLIPAAPNPPPGAGVPPTGEGNLPEGSPFTEVLVFFETTENEPIITCREMNVSTSAAIVKRWIIFGTNQN